MFRKEKKVNAHIVSFIIVITYFVAYFIREKENYIQIMCIVYYIGIFLNNIIIIIIIIKKKNLNKSNIFEGKTPLQTSRHFFLHCTKLIN